MTPRQFLDTVFDLSNENKDEFLQERYTDVVEQVKPWFKKFSIGIRSVGFYIYDFLQPESWNTPRIIEVPTEAEQYLDTMEEYVRKAFEVFGVY